VKRRILVLIKGLGRGGAEQLLVTAARFYDRERFEYEVAYLLPHKDDLVPDLRAAGIPVRCLGGAGPGWISRLRALTRARGYDLVHSHLPYAAIGARLGLRGKVRLVYTEHNVWDCYRPATRLGNMLTLGAEDRIFAVSQVVGECVRRPRALAPLLRMPPVETLYHGIDPEAVEGWSKPDGVRAELGIPSSAFVVGTVANFRTEKGYRYLVEAAERAHRARPDIRFVFVGRGPTEPEMRALTHRLRLDDAVVFAGYRPDAPRVCSAFDVFTLASVQEGLSIALVEAMALGKPAVVTTAGGLPEVVRDGVDGFVVPQRDADAMSARFVQLAEDRALAERFAAQARSRALEFDIRRAVERMERVYEELLS
jgi:glycosyltransferase involved in cell wall biosynthesis